MKAALAAEAEERNVESGIKHEETVIKKTKVQIAHDEDMKEKSDIELQIAKIKCDKGLKQYCI